MTKKKDAIVVHDAGLPTAPQEQSYSVELFISQAIEKNLPVETMERLLAMRKQLKEEQAIEAYHRAVSAFQGMCPIIEKKKKVYEKGTTEAQIKAGTAKVRYAYATLDSIVEQVAKPMHACGLSHRVEVVNEDKFITVTCFLIHELGAYEKSSFRVPIDFGAFMSAQQQYASALTYAKRYAFCDVTGILTGDEDNDANRLEGDGTTTVTVQPPATKPAAPLVVTNVPKGNPPITVTAQPPTPPVNPEDAKKQRIIKLMRENGLQPTASTKEGWEDAVKKNLGMELKPENYDKIIEVLSASVGGPPDEPTAPPASPKAPDASPTAPSSTTDKPAAPDATKSAGQQTAESVQAIFGGEIVDEPSKEATTTMADWRRAAGDCKNTAEALALIKAMESAGEKKTSISMIHGVLVGRKMLNS